MAGSADPTDGFVNELDQLYARLLNLQSTLSPKAYAERVAAIAQAYVKEYPSHLTNNGGEQPPPGAEPDTPGVELVSWSLWQCLLKALENWDTENELEQKLDRAIAFVKALQNLPEEPKWWLWGRQVTIKSLPLVGPSMREEYNGPFTYEWMHSDAYTFPEFQNALAGAPPISSTPDKKVNIATACRKRWLAIQGFIVRLWIDAGVDFSLYSIWATRKAFEDWPVEPPSIFETDGEGDKEDWDGSPASLALEVEAAAIWLRLAGPQIHALTEIWGPNGNPDWPPYDKSAPGRGGERWKGVDGMDKEKRRWALWREVLHEVIAWYDREQAAGRGTGWKVKEAATAALEAMHNVDQK